jgi:hypothetical protein
MVRKIFKWVFKAIVGLVVLAASAYGGFHLWEYASGGKYVKYLAENSETIPLDETFSYETIGKDVADAKLVLVGEIHGFNEPCRFDVDFFKYLHQNFGVSHYFAEMDFVQARFLNQFLATGDETLLNDILKNWAVFQGRNNQDYFNKYVQFQQYYQQLPADKKFQFIGIDKTQDVALTTRYINQLMPADAPTINTLDIDSILQRIVTLSAAFTDASDTLSDLRHIQANLQRTQDKENRENVLFANFHSLYKRYQLENTKVYGFFGLYHVFQYRVDGDDPLAAKIRKSDLGLDGKILSVNFMFNDSQMVMPSSQLPEFMRDPGQYTRMPISADNMLFVYVYGIKDLKRMTPNHHKSLIKMNADDSPYATSNRMSTTFQLLPVTDLFDMTDKGKPYVQYTIFVRNSDWAAPMETSK